MFNNLKLLTFACAALLLTGCANLAKMKSMPFQNGVEPDKTMVNIVRRSVFMGDGAVVEIFDGENLVGTLGAGDLIQYKTEPGEHTFFAYVQGSWGIARGNLEAGKTYYLKFNMQFASISLGVADANDERIPEWNTMDTFVLDKIAADKVPEKYITKIRQLMTEIDSGKRKVTEINARHAI